MEIKQKFSNRFFKCNKKSLITKMKGKKMKISKLLAILFVTIVMLSNVSFGQNAIPSGTARFEALGYNPFLVDAAIGINTNPAWASQYRNYTFGDIGRNVMNDFELDNQFVAVNFGVSKEITLGMVLNKREDGFNNFIGDPTYDSAGISQPIVPFKLLFSWSNKDLSLGFAPYYTSWSDDWKNSPTSGTTTEAKKSAYSLGATAGILAMLNNKAGWIEGAVDFKMNKFKLENTGTVNQTVENEGGMQFAIGTRGFFILDKKTNFAIVPYLGFGMYSWNPKNTLLTTLLPQYSQMQFNGGVGINTKVLDDGLLIGGLSFGYQSYKTEQLSGVAGNTYTDSYFILPKFNLGLEWTLTDWMQGRLGYSREVSSRSQKSESATLTQEYSNLIASNPVQTVTMGLGLQFARFSLDGTIGERLLKEGPYVITGKNNSDLFGVISASYNFNR